MKNLSVRLPALLISLLLGSGCASLKDWFTPQGQKLTEARYLVDHGNLLGASATAVEALALEPGYEAARTLLNQTFAPGQAEFHESVSRLDRATSDDRWDQLYEIYRWQNILATVGAKLPPIEDPRTGFVLDLKVEPVGPQLREAAAKAAEVHWDRARNLLAVSPGPRQARVALAEGRKASSYDAAIPGLSEWLVSTREAATQKVLVVPFYSEGRGYVGSVSGLLGSRISRNLLQGGALPELTEVFSSDRLVTLPGGGLARSGLISQPDALKLASDAGQNVVLLGQVTRATYQPPKSAVTVESRERQVVIVDPDHPQGVTKQYQAKVTSTVWTSSVQLTASFAVVEVPTGRDLVTAIRDAAATSRVVETRFTGDREALSSDDLRAISDNAVLTDADALVEQAVASLAAEVAEVVRTSLR